MLSLNFASADIPRCRGLRADPLNSLRMQLQFESSGAVTTASTCQAYSGQQIQSGLHSSGAVEPALNCQAYFGMQRRCGRCVHLLDPRDRGPRAPAWRLPATCM